MSSRSLVRARLMALAAASAVFVSSCIVVNAADAATPVSPQDFNGPSAHNRFVVDINVTTPRYIEVTVGTPSTSRGGCPAGNFTFNGENGILKSNGTFSVVGYFSTQRPQFKITVTGVFTSARSVRGSVVANHGCGTDSFVIVVPPPAVVISPCTILAKAGGDAFFGAKVPTPQSSFDAHVGVGQCYLQAPKGAPQVELQIEQTQSAIEEYDKPYVTPTKVGGLGSGASIDQFSQGGGEFEIQIFFHQRFAWAYMKYVYDSSIDTAAFIHAEEGRILKVARKAYSYLA